MSARRHDEGPGGDQGLSSSNVTAKRPPKVTPNHRPSPTWHAVAVATQVKARTGERRWLLTYRCPSCPLERHLAQAKALRDIMVRRTACGSGLVALHVVGAAAVGA